MRAGLWSGTLHRGTALMRLATTIHDHRARPPLLVGSASGLSPGATRDRQEEGA